MIKVAIHVRLCAGPYERRERKPPKKGKTIYVKGPGLNEQILRSAFGSIGTIVNISMEGERKSVHCIIVHAVDSSWILFWSQPY